MSTIVGIRGGVVGLIIIMADSPIYSYYSKILFKNKKHLHYQNMNYEEHTRQFVLKIFSDLMK